MVVYNSGEIMGDGNQIEPLHRGEPYHSKNWKKIRFEHTIASVLNRNPPLKKMLITAVQKYRLLQYKLKSTQLMNHNSHGLDVDKIYWINPASIVYTSIKEFDINTDKGKTFDGIWDQLERPFDQISVFVAFRQRFIEGKNWEDTAYYQRILKKIEQAEYMFGCKNKADLDKRFKSLEQLYEKIKQDGYKSQQEILSKNNTYDPIQGDDEISVNIGRDGDLLFNNGAHRLSIAKLLGIQSIPVKITVRHLEWMNFKKQIQLYAKDQEAGVIYQPLTHIDLQEIPSFYDREHRRFSLIQKKGNCLDIGANWGYFSQRLEEVGFDCFAVENDPISVYFLKKLKRANNKKFIIYPKNILEVEEIDTIIFDIVLALNIFHHFLYTESDYKKLIGFLNKLKVKELFVQIPNDSELQGYNLFKKFTEEEFKKCILENVHLSKMESIGADEHGRNILKFY